MKKLLFVLPVLFFFTANVNAQFEVGKHFIGPSLGVGFGGYGVSFGADYEYAMSVEEIGFEGAQGTLGIGGIFRYYNWSENFGFLTSERGSPRKRAIRISTSGINSDCASQASSHQSGKIAFRTKSLLNPPWLKRRTRFLKVCLLSVLLLLLS